MRQFRWFPLVLGAMLLLPGCATAPSSKVADRVEVVRLGADQVKKEFGLTQRVNPFIAPRSLLGESHEFFVYRLSVQLGAPAKIEIDIDASSPDNPKAGSLWAMEDFKELWRGYPQDEADMLRREDIIDSNMVPGDIFTLTRGSREFIIPLVARRPVSKPLEIKIRVLYGLQEYLFEETVR